VSNDGHLKSFTILLSSSEGIVGLWRRQGHLRMVLLIFVRSVLY